MTTATAPATALVTLADLKRAQSLIRPVAVRTPLLASAELSAIAGVPIWLKPESLQRGGAFKFRGAYNFLSQMDPASRKRGVIAPSSGNHAQAVALAAWLFKVNCTVVMPTTVTAAKRAGAERLGAKIELAGTTTQERMDRAAEIARDTNMVIVPPYDDPTIIAGQGTAGLEIVEDLPDVHTVLVPVGGGGLSAGVATAVKLMAPKARVIGVEPAGAPKLSTARAAGKPTFIKGSGSIADGLLAVQIGTLNFAHHQAYLDDVVLVDDAAMRRAVRFLIDRAKLVVEPSGAITIAAVMEKLVQSAGPTACVISGGNIEWDGLRELLA